MFIRMNKAQSSVRPGILFLLFALFTFFTRSGTSAALDPDTQQHPILSMIGHALDGEHIASPLDYRSSWPSDVGVTIPERPVLAPLYGFPVADSKAGTKPWMREVAMARASALLAYPRNDSKGNNLSSESRRIMSALKIAKQDSTELREFFERWLSTPKGRRIFVSFTSADSAYASTVKSALEDEGYAVFVFRSSQKKKPLVDPYSLGLIFDSSGEHFVIDSVNARASEGVYFEASFLQQLERPGHDGAFFGATADVYGRITCPRTQEVLLYLDRQGASVTYHDVDVDRRARGKFAEAAHQHKVGRDRGGNLLPAVRVNEVFVDLSSAAKENLDRDVGAACPSVDPKGLVNPSR